jgi:hypothetical protein
MRFVRGKTLADAIGNCHKQKNTAPVFAAFAPAWGLVAPVGDLSALLKIHCPCGCRWMEFFPCALP